MKLLIALFLLSGCSTVTTLLEIAKREAQIAQEALKETEEIIRETEEVIDEVWKEEKKLKEKVSNLRQERKSHMERDVDVSESSGLRHKKNSKENIPKCKEGFLGHKDCKDL